MRTVLRTTCFKYRVFACGDRIVVFRLSFSVDYDRFWFDITQTSPLTVDL